MCGGNRFSYTALVRQIKKLCLACMLLLWGLQGHAPQKKFKITNPEIGSEVKIYSYRDILAVHILYVSAQLLLYFNHHCSIHMY